MQHRDRATTRGVSRAESPDLGRAKFDLHRNLDAHAAERSHHSIHGSLHHLAGRAGGQNAGKTGVWKLAGCAVRMAERGGFEPPIRLHVCRISSAVHSTTLPPLRPLPRRSGPSCSKVSRRVRTTGVRTVRLQINRGIGRRLASAPVSYQSRGRVHKGPATRFSSRRPIQGT